jgi:hypothetical protein
MVGNLEMRKNAIWFIKGIAKLTFDLEIETAEGVIFGCYMKRMTNEIIGATAGIQKKFMVTVVKS